MYRDSTWENVHHLLLPTGHVQDMTRASHILTLDQYTYINYMYAYLNPGSAVIPPTTKMFSLSSFRVSTGDWVG